MRYLQEKSNKNETFTPALRARQYPKAKEFASSLIPYTKLLPLILGRTHYKLLACQDFKQYSGPQNLDSEKGIVNLTSG